MWHSYWEFVSFWHWFALVAFRGEAEELSQWQCEFRGQIRALRQWLSCMEMRLPPLDSRVGDVHCLPARFFLSLYFQFHPKTQSQHLQPLVFLTVHIHTLLSGLHPFLHENCAEECVWTIPTEHGNWTSDSFWSSVNTLGRYNVFLRFLDGWPSSAPAGDLF